jgi:hypothetical protein
MRRVTAMVVLAVVGAALTAADDKKPLFKFGKDDVGKLPAGWKADKTHKGEGSVWKVTADDTAPSKAGFVLAQTAEGPEELFNLCISQDSNFQDGEISVAFKAMKGKNDQGGGLVWRYQDADNYYICRMNPLEDNFRVYKVVAGDRKMLQDKKDLKIPAGEWHTIKVVQKGDHIECSVDDKKYLDVKDDAFPKAGKVGLWTKSDAQTYFDDLQVSGK